MSKMNQWRVLACRLLQGENEGELCRVPGAKQMLPKILGISLVGLLLIVVPAQADKKGNKNQPKTITADMDADHLPPGEFSGKLLSVPMPASDFIVEVSYQSTTLRPGARLPNQSIHASNQLVNNLQRIAQLEAQIQSSRTPQQTASLMIQLRQALVQLQLNQLFGQLRQTSAVNRLFQVTSRKKIVEFHAGDNITVRRLNLPTEYDEKGQAKQYTAAEKRKLKGNKPNLPGYEARLDDLTTGTIVKVTHASRPKSAKSVNKGDKEVKDVADQPKTQVTMIVILGEDPNAKTLIGDNQKPRAK